MSQIATFFHGSDTQWGIFYPKDYLVAVFPTFSDAAEGERQLRHAGFGGNEMLIVPGGDVVRYRQEHMQHDGLWAKFMSEISRIAGTEAIYADQDVELAAQGAAFLAIHAPGDEQRHAIWAVLEPLNVLAARHYSTEGIEVFRGAGADHASRGRVS